MSGANRLCIARGVLSSFSFQSSFELPTLAAVKTFSSFTQPVRPVSTPSVRMSLAATVAPAHASITASIRLFISLLAPVLRTSYLSVLLQPDVPELDLHRRPDVHLESDETLEQASLGIVIDEDAGDVAVDDLGDHVAARNQMHLVPAVDVE